MEKIDIKTLEASANIFKAIAHPMRLAIIDALEGKGRMNVKEIYENVGLVQTAASRHLRILKDKGILNCTRNGKNVYYYLQYPDIKLVIQGMQGCATR
ncbi:MAG: helix-turn-helix transcriptional regulator [Cytophagales bacterium]|nr:helix-turn-helix transcriptional regulator [Cytophagales bacterium]